MASPRRHPPSSSRPPPPPSKPPPLEAEITVVSAKHLKNINWRRGDLKPYAVLYLEPDRRVASSPDDSGSTRPVWNERFALPVEFPLADALLTLEVFHSKPSETPKPLVGTARAPLRHLLDDAPSSSAGPLPIRTLQLRRPSGRPQGKVRIKVSVREVAPPMPPLRPAVPLDYHVPPPSGSSYYYSSAPLPSSVRDHRIYASSPSPPLPSGASNLPPPSTGPPYFYNSYSDPYSGYYSAPPAPLPAQPYYDRSSGYSGHSGPSAPVDYSSRVSLYDHKLRRNGDVGLGAGLAAGAVAGALGGLTPEEGSKNKKERIAERVERGLAARDKYNDYRTDY